MAYDGSIRIDTKIDGSGAQKGINGIKQSVLKMASALGVIKLVSAGVQMLGNSVQSAFSRIDVMEQFDRTMTAITKDSNAAAGALNALKGITKGTAYGLDVAAKATQDFVTRGLDIEKATNRVGIWADAVAFYGKGTNEQLSEVTDALAKMSTKGKVEMDQLNRLFDAGIDAVGMYAKATGRSSADVQDDLSKGKISTEQFLTVVDEAMAKGTNGVQKIAGAAKEAGASWQGTMDNMKAAVTRGMVGILDAIDGGLQSINLPTMRQMIAQFGSEVEKILGQVGNAISGSMSKVWNVVTNTVTFLQNVFGGVTESLMLIVQAVQRFISDIAASFMSGGIRAGIEQIGYLFSTLGNIISHVAQVILPILSSGINLLGNRLNILLPLMIGVVVAMKAWKAFQKITAIIQNSTKAIEAAGIADGKRSKAAKEAAKSEEKKAIASKTSAAADKVKAAASKSAATAEEKKAKSTQSSAKAEAKEGIETVKSTATLTIKQAVIGVLTGQIKLATAAQELFNGAMAAAGGKVGLVISAVTGVVAIIGTLAGMLGKSSQAMNDGFTKVAEGAKDFQEGIANASSHLDEFNTNLFASSEEQQQLQSNMDSIQQGITDICKRASDERRNYTAQELQQLDEYFNQLNILYQKQLDIEKARSNAISQQAIDNANNFTGSLDEYKTTSQEWIKTAQEEADETIKILKQQTTQRIVNLNKQYTTEESRRSEAYQQQLREINSYYNQEVANTQNGVAKVTEAYTKGYIERAGIDKLYTEQKLANNQTLQEILKKHAQNVENINSGMVAQNSSVSESLRQENNNYKDSLIKVTKELFKNMDETKQRQIGTLIGLAKETAEAGGQIDESTKGILIALSQSYSKLNKETKENVDSIFSTLEIKIDDNGKILYTAGDKAGQEVFKGLNEGVKVEAKRATPEIEKKMREAGLSVSEGLKKAIQEKSPEAQQKIIDLLKQLSEATGAERYEIIKELQGLGIDATNAFTQNIRTEETRKKATELLGQLSTATDEQKPALLMKLSGLGMNLGDNLILALAAKEPEVQAETLKLLNQLSYGKQLKEPELTALFSGLGLNVPNSLIQAIALQEPNVQNATFHMLSQIGNGVALQKPQTEEALRNLGVSSCDVLTTTLASKSPEVQMQALGLLQQLKNATDQEKPNIQNKLMELGVAANDGIVNGLKKDVELVKEGGVYVIKGLRDASGQEIKNITPEFAQMLKELGIVGVAEMDAYMEQAKVSAPKVEGISEGEADSFTNDAMSKIQRSMNGKSVKVKVEPNVGQTGFSGHAYGGLVTKQQLSWLAEGNKPEIVIPLSSGMRSRGLQLWEQAGKILGINLAGMDTKAFVATAKAGIMAQQSRIPTAAMLNTAAAVHSSSMSGLANELREACKEGCESANLTANVHGQVTADGRKLGEIVTPYVDRNLGSNVERKARYG